MFCPYCGGARDEGARFCKSCGNAVPAPAPAPAPAPVLLSRLALTDPAQAFQHHVRVLGIVWLSCSAFQLIMSIWILVFSHCFLPTMQDIVSRGDTPFPFPIVHFLHVIYALSSAFGMATGIFGVIAGAMLLQKSPPRELQSSSQRSSACSAFPLGLPSPCTRSLS
jgi:hypothetical protein